jgi:hypothetical protein
MITRSKTRAAALYAEIDNAESKTRSPLETKSSHKKPMAHQGTMRNNPAGPPAIAAQSSKMNNL